jgi:predicted metal-dependent phosphoesterase TrpH
MYKADLHTHSAASPDGGLSAEDYKWALESHVLDIIAVTDHDTIAFAEALQQSLGACIIVGEEISSTEGDIIGLYLKKHIRPGMTAPETVDAIHAQGGLVYIPHPFEKVRKGLQKVTLDALASKVDIIETYNGRSWLSSNSSRAQAWTATHNVSAACSSDTHGRRGWGKTYSLLADMPTQVNLLASLLNARSVADSVGLIGRLYPKLNRIRKHLRL